jgi:hypothetical protein
MKKILFAIVYMFALFCNAQETPMQEARATPVRGASSDVKEFERILDEMPAEQTAVIYAGYFTGAVVGANMAANATATTIGTTLTGEAIKSAPFLPVFGGAVAGAIVGAATGYYAYKGYKYIDNNHERIGNDIKLGMHNFSNRIKDAYDHAKMVVNEKLNKE